MDQQQLYLLRNLFIYATFYLQIFYDLVRQINRKNPDPRSKKTKKSKCEIL